MKWVTGRPLGAHLAEDIFGPLGMTNTALWVPKADLDRLPAAYRHGGAELIETEPVGGGFYAGPNHSTSATASWSPQRETSTALPRCPPMAPGPTGSR
jgi:CubicO group peptidase (beta-lactamase class C family)